MTWRPKRGLRPAVMICDRCGVKARASSPTDLPEGWGVTFFGAFQFCPFCLAVITW